MAVPEDDRPSGAFVASLGWPVMCDTYCHPFRNGIVGIGLTAIFGFLCDLRTPGYVPLSYGCFFFLFVLLPLAVLAMLNRFVRRYQRSDSN